MFVGHYSAAFLAKAAKPQIPLWVLLLAAQFVDILWAILVLAGVEQVRLDPALPSNPLELEGIPVSHSLPATFFWSALAFAAARRALGLRAAAAGIVAATCASHWFLDFLVHRPDLPVFFGPWKVGLGTWNYPIPAYLLEIALLCTTAWLCARSCRAPGRGPRPWLVFAAGLLVLQTATSFGRFPTSVTGMVIPALLLYLAIPWVGARVERAAIS